MLSSTDYDKLQQIMQENPENEALINRLLTSHQMEISTISHEIRNPLTLVYSTLQLIESQHPEVLTFSHWTELHQDIEYMKFLLEDLSSYNNGERLELTPVSASTYFRRIALSFAASIVDTDIEFVSRIPEDLPEISADPVKLRQAVLNLLRNACDALTKKLLIPRSRSLHSLSLSRQILCISGSGTTDAASLPKTRRLSSSHLSLTNRTGPVLDLQSPAGSSRHIMERSRLTPSYITEPRLPLRFRYSNTPIRKPAARPPMCAILSTPPLVNP